MESQNGITSPTVNIEEEMRQSYMDYAMSVIVGRALPDVRDGLKPVQRRILYAMFNEGLLPSRKHSKCAGVVGEVLKRFHPHGDIPVYDALVRLAQPWNLRYPLVDGQGNFGSIDGDPPAAYRYTESRLTAFAEVLLRDIDKDTIDFTPNFDETTDEPLVLPAILPNLVVNGADGIAVGMATHIPPHNLVEVVNGVIALIKNPKLTLPELMQLIPGPDFPTGGIIFGSAPIRSAYSTGKGVIQIRARYEIENLKGKSREIEAIVVSEIPFQVNKSRLIERIAELVNEKVIDGIARLRDESDRSGMRIVMELKRDATREVVLNQLFKHTPMQESFGIINLAIVEGRPVVCSLIDLLTHFISHRRDVIVRRTQFELRKAEERMHILEGFRIALLNIDDIIALIKKAQTPKEAKDGLIAKYSLSEIQAQAILELRLQKLTGMERLAVEQEHKELAEEIKRLMIILADSNRVDSIIVGEVEELRDKFGDKRRTELLEAVAEIDAEDLIEEEEMVVSVSHQGYIKRTATNLYRAQKRGGKGVSGAIAKDEDFIEYLFVTSTLADLLVFTTLGRIYWQRVWQIPEAGRSARGRALVNLLSLKPDEAITAILPVREFVAGKYLVMCSTKGIIKKVELMEFARARKSGMIACTLKEGDTLMGVELSSGKDDIILATKDGMAIRFNEDQVRAMGRGAAGVRGITLEGDDRVVGMEVITGGANGAGANSAEVNGAEAKVTVEVDEKEINGGAPQDTSAHEPTMLTVCENGFGKRTAISDYRPQNRGGKGLIDIKTDERNGGVVSVSIVADDTELMLIASSGTVIRFSAADLSVIGRNTKGVRIINLESGEKVAAVARIRDNQTEE